MFVENEREKGERMNPRRIEITIALFVLGFALLAIPIGATGYESLKERYPAHVTAQGNLNLTGDPGTFEIIGLQANFTAMVPTQLAHGSYSALFSGKAHATNQTIFFRGDLSIMVNAEEYEFHASFTVPNTFEIPVSGEHEHEYEHEYGEEFGNESEYENEYEYEYRVGMDSNKPTEEYEASGELDVTIQPISTPLPTEKTWVKIKGLVNSSGGEPAFGWLKAHAKLGEWTHVRAFWTTMNLPANGDFDDGDDDDLNIGFTFSYYAAVLANATMVEIGYSDSAFYIQGLWNLYNISWTYHGEGNFTYTFESVLEDAEGDFTVTADWRYFTLAISDVVASGKVVFLLHRSFAIPRGDVNDDYIVDVWDLVHIAKRYGTTPGKPDFDFDIDFDDDFEVGLGELTTIAANLGTEY